MTTIDPTDEDAEEQMEQEIIKQKRKKTKYGGLIGDQNGDDDE